MDARDGYKVCKSKKEKETYLKTLTEIVQALNDNVKKVQEICAKHKQEKVIFVSKSIGSDASKA